MVINKVVRIMCVIVCVVLLLSICAFAINDQELGNTGDLCVSWTKEYNTERELFNASDIVIRGTVISLEPEIRSDIVFTKTVVEINTVMKGAVSEKSRIEVLLTGGSFEGKYTPFPVEQPLLEKNQEYKLYLYNAQYSEKYGNYCLISGGYQGILEINEEGEGVPVWPGNSIFTTNNTTKTLMLGPNDNTPTTGYKWNISPINVYIQTSIASQYSTHVYSGIVSGMNSWHLNSDAPSINVVTNYALSDVRIQMANYGETGWDAQTYRDSSGNYYVVAVVSFNAYYNTTYYGTSGIWAALSCHEFGHVYGLNHHVTNALSIMRPGTHDFYNPSGYPQWTTPQIRDILAINSVY